MSVFTKVLRAGEGKKVRRLAELVPLVNALEPEIEALSDDELRACTPKFRERLANGESYEDILVEAFAVVREGAWRGLGPRHFDAPLMGGMALHFGWIAEMKTGEGKTLVSTLPVYLNSLSGKGVHVVTVNDYLASRDSEWMGRLHTFLGLTVGRVGPDVEDAAAKRAAYASDVTYGTNTEFGFDYLRDNMARTKDAMVQRGHPPPTDHFWPGLRVGQALLPVRRHRQDVSERGRLRGRRGKAHRRPHRGRYREGRTPTGGGQPLRRGGGQLRPSPHPGHVRQRALPAGQGLLDSRRGGEDR